MAREPGPGGTSPGRSPAPARRRRRHRRPRPARKRQRSRRPRTPRRGCVAHDHPEYTSEQGIRQLARHIRSIRRKGDAWSRDRGPPRPFSGGAVAGQGSVPNLDGIFDGRAMEEQAERALAKLLAIARGRRRAVRDRPPREELRAEKTFKQRMKTSNEGFQQCYNAQAAVDGAHQLVVATDVTANASDQGGLPVLLDQVQERFDTQPETVLADSGYCNERDLAGPGKRGASTGMWRRVGRTSRSPTATWRSTRRRAACWRSCRRRRAGRRMRSGSGCRRRRTAGSSTCWASGASASVDWRRCGASGTWCVPGGERQAPARADGGLMGTKLVPLTEHRPRIGPFGRCTACSSVPCLQWVENHPLVGWRPTPDAVRHDADRGGLANSCGADS